MATTDPTLDDELEALLREEGIDPKLARARQAELARRKPDPALESRTAAERAELREGTRSFNEFVAENGLLSDYVSR